MAKLMITIVLLSAITLTLAAPQQRGGIVELRASPSVPPNQRSTRLVEERPQPYSFSFDETDEFGTRMTREESGDEKGNVKGSYSYMDKDGVQRVVTYSTIDGQFFAEVTTNEDGVISHRSAGATYIKN